MGKILKFCNSCEEGFAERFTFCPVCGASLQAVQLNPVETTRAAEPVTPPAAAEPQAPAFIEDEVKAPAFKAAEPEIDEVAFASAPTEEIPVIEEEEIIKEEPVAAAPAAAPAFVYKTEPMHADEPRRAVPPPIIGKDEDGFHVTVIEETNGKQRNMLLLGATALTLFTVAMAWGVSLFMKDLDVGSIGDDRSLALLLDDVPMPVEDEPQVKKDKDAGGGGGGGREDEREVSQGDMADQTPKPLRAPDAKTHRMDDPALVLPPASTEGNKKFPKEFDRYGDPTKFGQIASNGPGTGGGLGSGTGLGQGSGTGTGAGSGSGSGYGGGRGNGNGDGEGDGDGGDGPPPVASGVSKALVITSKPRARYTDEARKNNVTGSVTLRVTFLASGQIGAVSVVKGLPHGLTESAIAAVKQWTFEPQMVNGRPKTTTRPVTVGFNIY